MGSMRALAFIWAWVCLSCGAPVAAEQSSCPAAAPAPPAPTPRANISYEFTVQAAANTSAPSSPAMACGGLIPHLECNCSFAIGGDKNVCQTHGLDVYPYPLLVGSDQKATCNVNCANHMSASGETTTACSTLQQHPRKLVQEVIFRSSGHRNGDSQGCQGSGEKFSPEYYSSLYLPGDKTDSFDVVVDIATDAMDTTGHCYIQITDRGIPKRQAITASTVQLHLQNMKPQNSDIALHCTDYMQSVASYGGHGEELSFTGKLTMTVVATRNP